MDEPAPTVQLHSERAHRSARYIAYGLPALVGCIALAAIATGQVAGLFALVPGLLVSAIPLRDAKSLQTVRADEQGLLVGEDRRRVYWTDIADVRKPYPLLLSSTPRVHVQVGQQVIAFHATNEDLAWCQRHWQHAKGLPPAQDAELPPARLLGPGDSKSSRS